MATKNSRSSGGSGSSGSSGSSSGSGGISDDMRKLLAHQLEIKSWLLEVINNRIIIYLYHSNNHITTIG